MAQLLSSHSHETVMSRILLARLEDWMRCFCSLVVVIDYVAYHLLIRAHVQRLVAAFEWKGSILCVHDISSVLVQQDSTSGIANAPSGCSSMQKSNLLLTFEPWELSDEWHDCRPCAGRSGEICLLWRYQEFVTNDWLHCLVVLRSDGKRAMFSSAIRSYFG